MNNWLITKSRKVNINDIPVLSFAELRSAIISTRKRLIAFFGQKQNEDIKLFVILADDINSEFYLTSTIFDKEVKSYESLTNVIPAFHNFEREFYEEFGIEPLNHPWLKPLRNNQDKYEFFKMTGEEVHEVAVGPIHAGVIEPGHFRFMCNGEDVYHLEIMLGYQHKGVEKLIVKSPSNQLAESICGDSVIAYNTVYSEVIEQLSNCNISNKAKLIRLLALEMERIAIHIGDLGAISGDIAYLMGASIFGATRTLIINTMLEICGSRFGRGLINVGGVNFDLSDELISTAKQTFSKVEKDVRQMVKTMLKNSSVMSRLEKTGVVSKENAEEIGLVGMAARSCGVELDSRFDFKSEMFNKVAVEKKQYKYVGDVFSRFMLRYNEIKHSFRIIENIFKEYENLKNEQNIVKTNNQLDKNSLSLSIVEGWRGEVIHIALTDNNGNLSRYKIKDPSFNNWYGLALAVRNNGVSDFPLCNKSFNLSYTGNDL